MPQSTPYELRYYVDENDNAPVLDWLRSLRDTRGRAGASKVVLPGLNSAIWETTSGSMRHFTSCASILEPATGCISPSKKSDGPAALWMR